LENHLSNKNKSFLIENKSYQESARNPWIEAFGIHLLKHTSELRILQNRYEFDPKKLNIHP
jgi:hypothetical protein